MHASHVRCRTIHVISGSPTVSLYIFTFSARPFYHSLLISLRTAFNTH